MALPLLVHLALAANWYVDASATGASTGASWNDAWPSFQAIPVDGQGRWVGVQPGDTVWIAGGTYPGPVEVKTSGTQGAPLRIKASQEAGRDGLITLTGGFNITANWVTVDGAAADDYATRVIGDNTFAVPSIKANIRIKVDGAVLDTHGVNMSHAEPTGITLKWLDLSTRDTAERYGVRINPAVGVRDIEIAYCWIHDVGQDAVHVSQNGNIAWDAITVHHSLLERMADDGLEVGPGTTLHHSIVRDTRWARGHPDGVQSTGSFQRIYNNVFEDWANSYIRTQGFDVRYEGMHIYGNLFYADRKYADGSPITWEPNTATAIELAWYGNQMPWNTRDVSDWTDWVIANNTMARLGSTKMAIGFAKRAWLGEARLSNVRLQNNIFWNVGEVSGTALGVPGMPDGGAGWRGVQEDIFFSANLVHKSDAQSSQQVGYLIYGDLDTAWGKLCSTVEKINELTIHKGNTRAGPSFGDGGIAYALERSDLAAQDKGLDLSSLALPGLTVDLAGTPRGQRGGWDIGAIETRFCASASECINPGECQALAGAACTDGVCTHPPAPDGTACADDADACTADVCRAGRCAHEPTGQQTCQPQTDGGSGASDGGTGGPLQGMCGCSSAQALGAWLFLTLLVTRRPRRRQP